MKHRTLPTLAAVLIFLSLSAILLNKSLLPGYTLLPLRIIQDILPWDHLVLGPRQNRLLIDPFFSFYPRRFLLTQALQAGTLPLWNPYTFAGTPAFANPNFQLFYWPNWIAALIWPTHDALPWLALFHLTLTGTLMYLFLRAHRLHWLAGVLGGGVWMLNGYTLVWLQNPHRLSTSAWIPGIFWALTMAIRTRRPRWTAVGGLFLGMAILGGQVQFIFIMGLILGLYTLILTWQQGMQWTKETARPFTALILISLIGLTIGALVLLPGFQFAALSHRDLATAVNIQSTRWPLPHLITLVAPDFFGNPATPIRYWGALNYAETAAYFGAAALLLALTAPLVARATPLRAQALVLGIVTLAITLGTPLVQLFPLLPGGSFMVLNRTIWLIPLAGSWLAALALDGWLSQAISWQRRRLALGTAGATLSLVIIGIVVWLGPVPGLATNAVAALSSLGRGVGLIAVGALLLLLLSRWLHQQQTRKVGLAGGMLVALALVDLLAWGRPFNPINPIDILYPYNNVVEHLRQETKPFRILALQAETAVFGPNVPAIYRLETLTGYGPLIKADHVALIRGMDDDVAIGWMRGNDNMLVMSHFHPLTALYNVKYVLSARPLDNPHLQQSHLLDGVYIYENPAAMPRAFLVHHAVTVPSGEAGAALLSGDIDWRQTAVVETPLPAAEAAQLTTPIPPQGTAVMRSADWNQVVVDVETAAPTLLVLSDAYYPGWQAHRDDEIVPIYETNDIVRGVYVPAGEHTVTFTFRPPILSVAAALAAAGLLLVATLLIWDWRNH